MNNSSRPRPSRCPFVASILAVVFILTGCNSGDDRILEQTVQQSYKVDPGASISIRNSDGSIMIYGSTKDQLEIFATKKAYKQDRLEQITINVNAQPGLVSIDTTFPPKSKFALSDRSGTVDYVITIPQTCSVSKADLTNGEIVVTGLRGKSVHASLVNGHLTERNCFSDVDVLVANGSLDVIYDWWEERKFALDATIVSGNTRAFIPGKASFHLVAGTGDGKVASDFTEQADRHGAEVKKVDTFVGKSSDIDIKLQATSGNIRIAESNP